MQYPSIIISCFSIYYQGDHILHLIARELSFKLENTCRKMPSSEYTTLISLRQQIPQQWEVLNLLKHSWKSYTTAVSLVTRFYQIVFKKTIMLLSLTDLNNKFLCVVCGPSLSAFNTRNFTDVSTGSQT